MHTIFQLKTKMNKELTLSDSKSSSNFAPFSLSLEGTAAKIESFSSVASCSIHFKHVRQAQLD
jgi:hypothetical protein